MITDTTRPAAGSSETEQWPKTIPVADILKPGPSAPTDDILLVSLQFDSMIGNQAQLPQFTITLDTHSGFTDSRVVTKPTRRHQFLIPLSDIAFDSAVIQLNLHSEVPLDSALTEMKISAWTARRDTLVAGIARRTIWIFGSPRSGSTWVAADLLCSLPPYSRPNGKTRNRLMDEAGLGLMLGSFSPSPETMLQLGNPETDLSEMPLDQLDDLFRRHLRINKSNHEFIFSARTKQAFFRCIRDLIFEHVLVTWGILDCDHVVFKAPNESHAADIVMEAFPEGRLLFLMRDGRDILRSRFSPFASQILAETTDLRLREFALLHYAHQWNWQSIIAQQAFDAHDPEKRLFLRYEDLRNGSRKAFRALIAFAEAELSESRMENLIRKTRLEAFPDSERGPDKPRQSGKIGGHAQAFSEQEIALMTRVMERNLVKYGYSVSAGKSSVSLFPAGPEHARLNSLLAVMPTGTVIKSFTGMMHDLWVENSFQISFVSTSHITGMSIELYIPALGNETRRLSQQIDITLNGRPFRFEFAEAGLQTCRLEADIPPLAAIELTLIAEHTIIPRQQGLSDDDRRLGFKFNRLSIVAQPESRKSKPGNR